MTNSVGLSKEWRQTLWLLIGYIVCLVIFYFPSIKSMVDIWLRSETFAHGFIIAPISLWLIWRCRFDVSPMRPNFQPLLLIPLVITGLLWLLSNLVDVLVVQQLAFVTLLILGVCAIVGLKVSRVIIFPLGYLYLMVPMGEELIPPLMDLTAQSTVALIRLTGIPVYQEGLFFSLPSGNWSVVEACSGIRYLIASVTLGALFAYLTYRSMTKRIVFVAFSVVVPVLANILRAYMIVMIGHYSGMTLAVGVDHLIYGWLFFGVVIFIMFLIGNIFKDPDIDSASQAKVRTSDSNDFPVKRSVLGGTSLIFAAMVWPLVPLFLSSNSELPENFAFMNLEVPDGWIDSQPPEWEWHPLINKAYMNHKRFYRENSDSDTVGVFISHYVQQDQDAEMVSSLDKWIIPELEGWRLLESSKVPMRLSQKPITVEQARLFNGKHELLVWRWYRVGEYDTASPYVAKLLEAISRLGTNATSARIYVVTPVRESMDDSRKHLQTFVDVLSPKMDLVLSSGPESL